MRPWRLYNIHRPWNNKEITEGLVIYDVDGICPPFGAPSTNMFQSTFVIKFNIVSYTFIRCFSSWKFTSTYGLDNKLTYVLSHPSKFYLLDCGISGSTYYDLHSDLAKYMDLLPINEFEFCDPSMAAVPEAISMVPYFTSGAIGTRLSSRKVWFDALKSDPMTELLLKIVKNPVLSDLWSNLDKLHSVCRQPARLGNFSLEHGVFYMK